MNYWQATNELSKELLESTQGLDDTTVHSFLGSLCSNLSHAVIRNYPDEEFRKDIIEAFQNSRVFSDSTKNNRRINGNTG